MSRNYDNWERLVAAVIKKQQIWELCHQHSRTPSICSEASSSEFSSSFRSSDEHNNEFAQKPIPKLVSIKHALNSTRKLGRGFEPTILTRLQHDVQVSDKEFLAKGTQLVVKKLRGKLKVREEEFKTVFGNCRHENVDVPRAYYFSNNGNYIFNDYHIRGNVYDKLSEWNSRLDWEQRLKIAIGSARGIAHIHKQCGGKLAHGNIRSSNIFINLDGYGCVSDFVLAYMTSISREQGHQDYHSSKYEFQNASQEGDAYSFGVFLLELLTGRSLMNGQGDLKNLHIANWARSIRPEDWSSELFDQNCYQGRLFTDEVSMFDFLRKKAFPVYSGELDIMKMGAKIYNYVDGMDVKKMDVKRLDFRRAEMMKVAIRCLAELPQDRPKMFEVLLMLENIPRHSTEFITNS